MADVGTLGALGGLGDALSAIGGEMISSEREKAKSALAERLEKEREERAEQRQIAREDRQAVRTANTVSGYRPEIDSEGVLWIQGHNAAGDSRGEKRLATPTELSEFKMKQDRDRITLEDLTTRAAVNKFKAGRLETEAAQDDALANAKLGLVNAQTGAANYRAAGGSGRGGRSGRVSLEESTSPVPLSDLVTALVDQEKKLMDEYDLSISDRNTLAKSVIQEARAQGKDPVDTLRQSLPLFIKAMGRDGTKKKSGLL